MQGEHLQIALAARRGETKHRIRDVRFVDPVAAEELIERGQRGRHLRTGARAAREQREERRAAAGIARIAQAVFPFELEAVRVDLPAGGRMRLRQEAEHALECAQPLLELHASPRRIGAGHMILPAHVIVGVQTDFETGVVARCASRRRLRGRYPDPAAARRTSGSSARSA